MENKLKNKFGDISETKQQTKQNKDIYYIGHAR